MTGWTPVDEASEEKLYLTGRSAFWLFPDRWRDVPPGEAMAFDDGTWQPPVVLPPPELDEMCPLCFSYKCESLDCCIERYSLPAPHGVPGLSVRCLVGWHEWSAVRLRHTLYNACLRCGQERWPR